MACKVSTHETNKRVLSLPMRHSNIDVLYVPTGLKKNTIRVLKPSSILEKMRPDDTNVFACYIIGKYKNWSDKTHSMCLADFTFSYVSRKAGDVPIGPDEIKSYTVTVSNIDGSKLNPKIIVLKMDFVKCRNIVDLSLFVLTKFPNWTMQKCITWDFYSYKRPGGMRMNWDRATRVMKIWNEPYLGIHYEELLNFSYLQSGKEENNAEFS